MSTDGTSGAQGLGYRDELLACEQFSFGGEKDKGENMADTGKGDRLLESEFKVVNFPGLRKKTLRFRSGGGNREAGWGCAEKFAAEGRRRMAQDM